MRSLTFAPTVPYVKLNTVQDTKGTNMISQDKREQLLADVEKYCEELRPIEELCYLEHRYNDASITLAKKYNLTTYIVRCQTYCATRCC